MIRRHHVALLAFVAACSSGQPTAVFTAPTTGVVATPLAFDASASAATGKKDTLSYHWDFGDGARGGTPKLAHAYAKAGAYTATLTVGDGQGHNATKTQAITISAGATSNGPMVPVFARLTDSTGAALAGVTATGAGVSATSAADGSVQLSLPSGTPVLLTLAKAGYASQFHNIDLTTALPSAYFEASLSARDPSQKLDAAKGGTISARDGSTVTLPANALVDSGGKPVTGAIDVALTPVNPSAANNAFPGAYTGVKADATSGPLLSGGTTEYALYNGTERLQLAPGKTAAIDIPVYVGKGADGSAFKVGAVIPLWSLDENTGKWVQEGAGTLAASKNDSATFTLHATVSHFSWWNMDQAPDGAGNSGMNCRCETFAEICAQMGKKAFTCHLKADVDQGGPLARDNLAFARMAGTVEQDIIGLKNLPFPSGVPYQVTGSAFAGALAGTVSFTVATGESRSDTITLKPKSATVGTQLADKSVTLPFTENTSFTTFGDSMLYEVSVTPGDVLAVSYTCGIGTAGIVEVLDDSAAIVASDNYDSGSVGLTYLTTAAHYTVKVLAIAPGRGAITIRVGTTTTETVTLPFDRTDSFDVGDTHDYAFPTDAGATYSVTWDLASAASGTVSISKGNGSDITSALALASGTQQLTADIGPYTLHITALAAASVRIRIQQISNAPGQTNEIPIALPFTASDLRIDVGTTQTYVIQGTSGGALVFAYNFTGGTVGAGIKVHARGKNGVETGFTGGYQTFAFATNPTADGTTDYLMEITGEALLAQLSIAAAPSATVHAVSLAEPWVTVTNGVTGQSVYTFDAAAGDLFNFGVTDFNGGVQNCNSFSGGASFPGATVLSNQLEGIYATAQFSGTQAVLAGVDLTGCATPQELTYYTWYNKLQSVPAPSAAPADAPLTATLASAPGSMGDFFTLAAPTLLSSLIVQGTPTACDGGFFVRNNGTLQPLGNPRVVASGTTSIEFSTETQSSCTSSVYFQPVATPTAIAIPTAGAKQTTLVHVGEYVYYSVTGDGSSKKLALYTCTANGYAHLSLYKPDTVTDATVDPPRPYPFYSQLQTLVSSYSYPTLCDGNPVTQRPVAVTLASGATYYVEVHALDFATSPSSAIDTQIVWYLE